MKIWAALFIGLGLLAGPALAQNDTEKRETPVSQATESTPSERGSGDEAKSSQSPTATKRKGVARNNGEPKKEVVTDQSGDKPKKKKVAEKKDATASTGDDTPRKKKKARTEDDADSSTSKKREQAASGAKVYKEGGKTCSGADEYKICW